MKFIGNIVHVANSGKLIGRSSQSPSIGVTVYNKKRIRLERSIMFLDQRKVLMFQ